MRHVSLACARLAGVLCLTGGLFTATVEAEDAPAPPPKVPLAKALAEAPTENTTSLSAALGGTLNTGNTRTWQANAGADYLLVRMPSEVVAALAFAIGQADLPDDGNDDFQDTVQNLRARLRYDHFITRMDAIFAASAFRWDPFAGIDARVQGDIGYLRYFYKTDVHRFWTEVGYDLTFDDYHPLPNPAFADDPTADEFTPDTTEVSHSARLFFGYDNRLNEMVTYLGGVEALMNLEQPRDTRVNMDNALRSKIGGNFSLEFKLSLQFDNVPVPGARKLDTQTIGSIIYNLI